MTYYEIWQLINYNNILEEQLPEDIEEIMSTAEITYLFNLQEAIN